MDVDGDELECQPDVEFATSLQHHSGTEERCQEAVSVPWSQLPWASLERIYSFLSRKDQSSMSQVCKSWSEEYSSPNLWRDITFHLPEGTFMTLTDDMYPAVRSAQRYGHYFQYVRILGRRTGYRTGYPAVGDVHQWLHNQTTTARQLALFLQFLAEYSQLLSISFANIQSWHGNAEDVHQSIINLLKQQNKLKSVKFQNTYFRQEVAGDIFQALFSRNLRTLKDLQLTGFVGAFWWALSRPIVTDLPSTYETLMNLKKICIDYSLDFENIIISIYEYGSGLRLRERGKLEKITLYCEDTERIHYNGIQPEVWKYIRESFPALEMKIYIELKHRSAVDIDIFLVRHIPVKELLLSWKADDSELRLVLLRLIECEINRSLEVLYVGGLKKTDNLAQDLLNFLPVFPLLKKLHLCVESRVNDLTSVFEYWLQNGPMSLKHVHIDARDVSESAVKLNYLADTYAPLLKLVGLKLIIDAD